VYTASTRTSYKVVPLTNLNKYLHYKTSEMDVNIHINEYNGSEKLLKNTAISGQLITAVYAS
jgi:hypothetical protein